MWVQWLDRDTICDSDDRSWIKEVLSTIQYEKGKVATAQKMFEEIVNSDATYHTPYHSLSVIWYNKGNYKKALDYVDLYLTAEPYDKIALRHKADALEKLHLFGEARDIRRQLEDLGA